MPKVGERDGNASSTTGQWLVLQGLALANPGEPMLASNKSSGQIEDSSLDYLEAVSFPLLAALFTGQTRPNHRHSQGALNQLISTA